MSMLCHISPEWPLQKLTDLEYKTSTFFPRVSPTDYDLFKHLDTFLLPKTFRLTEEAETEFKDFFFASESWKFYNTAIYNVVN